MEYWLWLGAAAKWSASVLDGDTEPLSHDVATHTKPPRTHYASRSERGNNQIPIHAVHCDKARAKIIVQKLVELH
jgi:hypothetical protein